MKRFGAHFALLVTLLADQSPPFEAVHTIVLSYVRHLMERQKVRLRSIPCRPVAGCGD